MKTRNLGLLQTNAAALLLGGTALFAQLIDLPAVLIITIRAVIAAVVLFVILSLSGQSKVFAKPKDYVMQLFLGFLMAVHWASYYHSIQLSTVTIGIATISAYPMYTVFIEAVCGHEKLRLSKVLITSIIVFGVFLLIPEFNLDNQSTVAVLWGVLSGLAYALRNVLTKPYLANYGGLPIMMHQAAVAACCCGVVSYFALDVDLTVLDNSQYILLLICGTIFTAGPHTLQVCAFAHLSASTVSNIVIMQVLYATVFALLILGGGVPDAYTIIGALCIVGGGILETYMHKTPTS